MRGRSVDSSGTRKWKLSHALLAIGSIYLLFISFKFHHFLEIANALSGDDSFSGLDRPVNDLTYAHLQLVGHRNPVLLHHDTFHRKLEDSRNLPPGQEKEQSTHRSAPITLLRSRLGYKYKSSGNMTQLEEMANEAWVLGKKAWDDVESYDPKSSMDRLPVGEVKPESCPSSLAKSSSEMDIDSEGDLLVFLPCGLAVGSSITVVGKPNEAHKEYVPQLARIRQGDGFVWVSQFMVELQGLRVVDGEDPPKILHLNPRVRGDWSKKPILELNSCYRMQWGTSIRCDGLPSRDEDDTGIILLYILTAIAWTLTLLFIICLFLLLHALDCITLLNVILQTSSFTNSSAFIHCVSENQQFSCCTSRNPATYQPINNKLSKFHNCSTVIINEIKHLKRCLYHFFSASMHRHSVWSFLEILNTSKTF